MKAEEPAKAEIKKEEVQSQINKMQHLVRPDAAVAGDGHTVKVGGGDDQLVKCETNGDWRSVYRSENARKNNENGAGARLTFSV